ncbi:Gfo/Idh/MocA family oxidoreductase [Rubellicoccus peritrichatus]|uniref:Gfo/Idh/MocA family oxidoreductase n=1 Tax=Rubellicoccus peritrichatus TaxID=3080537 RepID=A0AAQ3LAK9_9BACT|nr:Gfo/Idh/MocA family oxidoreductase [Puniceicoccus sp. CR14]WOO39973.1 Gfo/Idh/MocA family oxidoreductase [Puniceicoccus sp. CR14]
MKFGIIGTGMVADFHAKAIQAMDGGELFGVASSSYERAQPFVDKHKCKAYASAEELLAQSELDIVTIATPSGAHYDPAMAAIAAGKHVIVEKPLEITTQRIDEMKSAAAQAGVTLAAILNRRFHPAMDAFKKAIDNGRFGRLTSASAYIKWYRNQAYYDSAAWRGTWALDGGGVLINQSIHTIDILLHLAGPVKSVQASTACLAHENIEVEDIGAALLEFENGALGVIEGSTCSWSKDGHPARVQIAGTEGSVFLADDAFEIWDFMKEEPDDAFVHANLMKGSAAGLGANDPNAMGFQQHQHNFEEVVQAIREGREPSTSVNDARRSVELIRAIYESAQNNGDKILLGRQMQGMH